MKFAATGLGCDDTVKASSLTEIRSDTSLDSQNAVAPAVDSRCRPGLVLDRERTSIVDHGHVGSLAVSAPFILERIVV
jgi:hypothetical protein